MANKKYPGATVPSTKSLKKLALAVQGCRGCDLYKNATQAVFGSGGSKARIVLIGEQPGHSEDLAGEPFVGAAGGVLRSCLESAGLSLADVYLTNAVKHFKWTLSGSGKRRIHMKPSIGEVEACRPWLNKQLDIIQPQVLVILGATAVKAVLGQTLPITKERGRDLQGTGKADHVVISWHPSAILRSIDFKDSNRMRAELISALKLAARLAKK